MSASTHPGVGPSNGGVPTFGDRPHGKAMHHLRSLVAVAMSGMVAVLLNRWLANPFGVRGPLFSILANWVVMFWVALGGQFLRISFPAHYYAPLLFERTGRLYEFLGIRLFKALVRRVPLAIFSPTLRFPTVRTGPALLALDSQMPKAETGHMVIFALILVPVGCCLLRGLPEAAAWLLLFNIPINGCPVIVQRYNRIKLQGLIDGPMTSPLARV